MLLLQRWTRLLLQQTIHFSFLLLLLIQGHYSLHRDIPSSRYSYYTFRTARSDDGAVAALSPDSSYSDSYSRGYRSSPQSTYFSSNNNNGNTGSTGGTSNSVRFPSISSNSAATLSVVSQGNGHQQQQYISSSTTNPVVIRHPNSCSYDRSHAACTFSLLCYLANGVPVEGCEDNSSMTCCYLNSKGINAALVSGGEAVTASRPSTGTIYRHVYPASETTSSGGGGGGSALSSVTSYRSPVNTYHSAPNSISNYYNPSNSYRTVQTYQTSDTAPPSAKMTLESNSYVDKSNAHGNNYKIKEDLLAPYESKSLSMSKVDTDYYNNAIRRTRADGYKSFFQEIANRKLYARNYDVEDSKH